MPIVAGMLTQLPEVVGSGIVHVGVLSFLRCRETTELGIRSVDNLPLAAVINRHGFRQALVSKRARVSRQQVKAINLPPTFKVRRQFGNFRHCVCLGIGSGVVDGFQRID